MEKITKNIAHTASLLYFYVCLVFRVINDFISLVFRKKLLCFEIKAFFTV